MPHSERLETFKVLHLGHYAVNKMQLSALETVPKSQRSEPLQSHPTPEVPWHTVATDLFEIKNSFKIVDYYSTSDDRPSNPSDES